jgi:Domain of unknown function (DUF4835)
MKFIAPFLLFFALPAMAQELNCTVTINSDQLFAQQKTDFSYVNQLKSVISDLMNNRRWTNNQFQSAERINCTLTINLLKSVQQGAFEGTAQLVVTRPVYGTNYETTVLNYVDRAFSFFYLSTTPVFYRDNIYTDELTSILAFYANIVLAVDYDTFSKEGGSPYIQQAYNIMNLAQQASGSSAAWNPSGDKRNRYNLIENLQSQQLLPFRDAQYAYYRLGVDNFASNPQQVRKQTLDMLTMLRTVTLQKPGAVLLNSFFDAKADELTNILYEGTPNERKRGFDLLSQLDPGKTEGYRRLLR